MPKKGGGKKGGKGGLELSLLGYGPEMDHQHLTRQGRIRRIMMEAPDLSPFLRKATGDQHPDCANGSRPAEMTL